MGRADDVYELDELLGAYALDAVDAEERRRVEDYLQISPRAAAEVRDHREVATMLAFTGMAAPDGVWSRIAAEIDASEQVPPPGPELAKVFSLAPPIPGVAASADAEPAGFAQRTHRPRPQWTRTPWWLGAAAATVLVVAGVAVFGGAADAPGDPLGHAYAAAVIAEDSRVTELAVAGSDTVATGVIDAGGQGFLDAADLPALAPDMTYQLWGVLSDTGDVVSIGILGNDPTLEVFTVDGAVDALAVTIEQAPGVVADGNPDGAYVGAFG